MKGMKLHILLTAMCLTLTALPLKLRAMDSGDGLALPFFHNIPASEFGAHNVSNEILADSEGRIYVANFEGLVVWDGVTWTTIHSPGTSRFTSLFMDKNGRIWAAGLNHLGWVEFDGDGRVGLHFVATDLTEEDRFGEASRLFEDQHGIGLVTTLGSVYHVDEDGEHLVSTHEQREVRIVPERWGNLEVNKRLILPDGTILMATTTEGVIALNKEKEEIWRLNEETGLCSNSVGSLCYDEHGTVWGTTENGLFNISVSKVYTQFSDQDGLRGQVNTVLVNRDRLFAGTLQGLFVRENERFRRMELINQACRQLAPTPDGKMLIATANGVFIYDDKVKPLYPGRYALSLYVLDEESFLFGTVDGVFKGYFDGRNAEKTDDIPYVYRFTEGEKDSLWATDTYRDTYWSKGGRTPFVKGENKGLSRLLDYTDESGRRWKCRPSDLGLRVLDNKLSPLQREWLHALDSTNIQNITVNGNVAWLGGTFGLIRLDLDEAAKTQPEAPKVYIRTCTKYDRNFDVTVATNHTDFIGRTLYSYRLHLYDNWSPWGEDQTLNFRSMSYGEYFIQVRALDPFGNIVESNWKAVSLPPPFEESKTAIAIYIILTMVIIYLLYRWRVKVMVKRQIKLEQIVSERTRDLREAQDALIRQEREATVGKLTKGLIDRILNPMNYVGNFSHLTRGLIKDLRDDIEAERVAMSADNYDDATDIMDMMDQNLEKIEQHGLSTTRILKAMEEVLKERSKDRQETDLGVICQQDVDMLRNYYKEDIEKGHVECVWKRPEEPVMANVNAEQISQTLTALLGNAAYAIRRRIELGENPGAGKKETAPYQPRLALILERTPEGKASIRVWDNGIGIEETVIGKVFDPFFTTKPTAEASGIGLYLAQQIIQDHGGNITVTSEKYKFTEFTITL